MQIQEQYFKFGPFGRLTQASEVDASHVLLEISLANTLKEMSRADRASVQRLRQDLEKVRQECQGLKSNLYRLSGEKDKLADDLLRSQQAKSKLLEELDSLKQDLSIANQEILSAKTLNSNLIRIMTERANALRNIRPKKGSDGYIVLFSREWTEYLGDGETADVWRTTIQTPYDASMERISIHGQILDDLRERVLPDLGCDDRTDESGEYPEECDRRFSSVMYRWKMIVDYRSGFWIVEIYTTDELHVPLARRLTAFKGGRHHEKSNRPGRFAETAQ